MKFCWSSCGSRCRYIRWGLGLLIFAGMLKPLGATFIAPWSPLLCSERGAMPNAQELRENMDTDVRVLGIASSSRMLLSDSGVALDSWQETFDR
jgi:hypothetical protein